MRPSGRKQLPRGPSLAARTVSSSRRPMPRFTDNPGLNLHPNCYLVVGFGQSSTLSSGNPFQGRQPQSWRALRGVGLPDSPPLGYGRPGDMVQGVEPL